MRSLIVVQEFVQSSRRVNMLPYFSLWAVLIAIWYVHIYVLLGFYLDDKVKYESLFELYWTWSRNKLEMYGLMLIGVVSLIKFVLYVCIC